MANALKIAAVLAFGLLLASCGIPTPNARLLGAVCPPLVSNTSPIMPDGRAVFVTSSNLPDCREDAFAFARFRSHGGIARGGDDGEIAGTVDIQTFAISLLTGADSGTQSANDSDAETRPWSTHETDLHTHAAWAAKLRGQITDQAEHRLIVYIHGFNNDFEDVLERGTILQDLAGGNTPIVLVQWPSRDRVQSYSDDEASIAWAQDYISDVVAELTAYSQNITIVSHSMGARALIGAVERLQDRDAEAAGKIRRAVLISPDIDRHRVLRRGGALDRLLMLDREVLIYTSYRDLPIYASRVFHGYSRLGSSDCRYDVDYARREDGELGNCHWTALRDNFQIVETSASTRGGLLRHADVFDSCAGRYDLYSFLRGIDPAPWRVLGQPGQLSGASISAEYFEEREDLCAAVDFYRNLDGTALDDRPRTRAGPRRRF